MNPALLALGIPIGKYIVASALMAVFYWFLFREKTSFNNCRVYLLSIALVAILISQFNIVIYTPPAKVVEIEAQPVALRKLTEINTPTAQIRTLASPIKPTEACKYAELLTMPNIALGIYIAVTSALFLSLLIQLFRILTLKRRGKLTTKDGFELVESDEIPTPFSFYKTIFLSPNLTGSKLDMILKHEQWHIRHRHYIDVFMMEVLVRLLWFNPVLWWVRRELRNVSEFQTDRSVLDEGLNLYKYQATILEEVMGTNFNLTNGFNNSFTKKRFIMMKNKSFNNFTLGRTLILPLLFGVFSLLCFTSAKTRISYVEKNTGNSSSVSQKVQSSTDVVAEKKSNVDDLKEATDIVVSFDKSGNIKGRTLFYKIIDGTQNVMVTERNKGKYWGNIVVPEKVLYSGKTYFVTTIGRYAFESCSNLTSITLPKNLTNIELMAFDHCTSLTSIIIPDNVKSIGFCAFQSCSGLTSVRISKSLKRIENFAFSGCGITSINIPNSVKEIGEYAFAANNKLTHVVIPDGVNSIAKYAFNNCINLQDIVIPGSVTSIGEGALDICRNLKQIKLESASPINISDHFFKNVMSSGIALNVPKGSGSIYKEAIGWKTVVEINEF